MNTTTAAHAPPHDRDNDDVPVYPPARWAPAWLLPATLTSALLGGACRPAAAPTAPDEAARRRVFTDALYEVMSADREIYTKQVVNRLQNEENVLKATEHWQDEKTLPLPAQMFRMASERVREKTKDFTYSLLSLDPINKKNGPRVESEKLGLTAVSQNRGNHYLEETLGESRYFTAIYPDKAVSQACVDCHNGHPDSPRKDYKLGDVMGGIVIRVALGR
jgi:hypothetical protein